MKRLFSLLMCVVLCLGVQAQERKIPFNGLLKDANDKPIRKARVYISSPRRYVTTTKLGEFGLTNVQPHDTIKILVNKQQTYKVAVDGKKSMVIRLDAENGRIEVSESAALREKGFDHVSRRERDLGMFQQPAQDSRIDLAGIQAFRRLHRQSQLPDLIINSSGVIGFAEEKVCGDVEVFRNRDYMLMRHAVCFPAEKPA